MRWNSLRNVGLSESFFTTEVWTARGLVTYYTLFVLELQSRRAQLVGSTPNPDAAFMAQAARRLTDAVDGFLAGHRALICDRDGKWTEGFRGLLEGAGVRMILTPFQAPNANVYAERFVRSIRKECLDSLILFGERHLIRALDQFTAHYPGSGTIRGSATDWSRRRSVGSSAPTLGATGDSVGYCATTTARLEPLG
jgi:transposase InsO family protein